MVKGKKRMLGCIQRFHFVLYFIVSSIPITLITINV